MTETKNHFGKLKIFGQILLLMMSVLVLGFHILILYQQTDSGEDKAVGLPFSILVVTSGSMEPKIHAGDGLFVYETPYGDLQVGDIISFEAAGELVTHEIIRFEDGQPVTKGLANKLEDGVVRQEQYRVRTIFVLHGLSAVLAWTESSLSKGILILIFFTLFFGRDIMSRLYERLKAKE